MVSATMAPSSPSPLIPIPTHTHRIFDVMFCYVIFEALHMQVAEAAPESWEERVEQEAPCGERVLEEGGAVMEVEGEGVSSAVAGEERAEGMGSAMEVEGGGWSSRVWRCLPRMERWGAPWGWCASPLGSALGGSCRSGYARW